MSLSEDFDAYKQVSDELQKLLEEIENRFEREVLDKILRQCAIARRIGDPRYGNVREQITRVEAAVKVAIKTGKISDIHTAVTRVRSALDIHHRFKISSNST